MDRLQNFLSCLGKHSRRPCIQHDQASHTYEDLLCQVQDWQLHLHRLNIVPGSVIAMRADYSVAALAAFLAVLTMPAVVALIPLERNISKYLQSACASGLLDFATDGSHQWRELTPPSSHPLLSQLSDGHEGGIILFTSGSTGVPKAALHSLERFLLKFQRVRGRSFRTLAFLLFDHVAGLDTVFYTLTYGGTLIVTHRRDPESILAVIQSQRVEVLPTSPSFLRMLCAGAASGRHELSSLRIITYGSEPMDPSTLALLNRRFPNIQISQKYGTTETGSPRSVSRSSDSLWLKLSDDHVDTKVVDGVLWVRHEGTMLGYLNAPSPIIEDGWYCTGDLVEVDGEWIRFLGRETDLINVGGRKVAPVEVEQCILELDFVHDVAVFGEKHALLGQVVSARVMLRSAAVADPVIQLIRKHCRDRLAAYKVPIRIELVRDRVVNDRNKRQRQTHGGHHK